MRDWQKAEAVGTPNNCEDSAHRRCASEMCEEVHTTKEKDGPDHTWRRGRSAISTMLAITAVCMSLADIRGVVGPISLKAQQKIGRGRRERGGSRAQALIEIPHFPRVKMDAVMHTKQLRHCVEGATKIPQFSGCLSAYLSVLPSSILFRALSSEALSVKSEARHLEGQASMTMNELRRDVFLGAGADAIAASGLEACLSDGAGEESMAQCLTSSLSKVPNEVLSMAVKQAEAHPAFDWGTDRKNRAVKLSSLLYSCIRNARRVSQGDECLGDYLAALPQSLAKRSMRVVQEVPKPRGRPLYPL